MWILTEEAKKEIDTIYQYFRPLITEVSEEELYDRIFGGYCHGEGGFPLFTVKAWKRVLGLEDDYPPDTVFEGWDDYKKYKGNWYEKIKYQNINIADNRVNCVDTIVHQYRQHGQPRREWNRELFYKDMDSETISKWKSLSSREKVEAIKRYFILNPDINWDSFTYEEQEWMLLNNAFVEWD